MVTLHDVSLPGFRVLIVDADSGRTVASRTFRTRRGALSFMLRIVRGNRNGAVLFERTADGWSEAPYPRFRPLAARPQRG